MLISYVRLDHTLYSINYGTSFSVLHVVNVVSRVIWEGLETRWL